MVDSDSDRLAERLLEWWEAEAANAQAIHDFAGQLYLEGIRAPVVRDAILDANDRRITAATHIRVLRGIIEPPKGEEK